jgi:hypothetical protein
MAQLSRQKRFASSRLIYDVQAACLRLNRSLRKSATITNLLRIQTRRDTLILTVKRPRKMRLPIAPTPLPFDAENFLFRANQASKRATLETTSLTFL